MNDRRQSAPQPCLSVDARLLLGLLLLWSVLPVSAAAPVVHDPRLELTLFAADPDIVTPIGMAIDDQDRLFVVESHTHHPPADYRGPTSDRIKRFVDAARDGKPGRSTVFAEGIREAMNLAFSPRGELFVVCAREVWALPDANGDGVCEAKERRRVLHVETSNKYAHSCLLGIAFSPDGWLYVSRGNNGSAAYTLHGTDDSKISGWGDGGNIVRCRPDGSRLEEFATGFWNPFDLRFDHAGRLLLVDNDPDARGPNRFVHVVAHGDYGYKSIYGGGGNHPYQGWDGDLPGTLPYIDGTGEAPCALLDCAQARLPSDYRDHYLVSIWNENSVARYATQPRGVSLTATHSNLITGGQDFRPVALAADSRGDIYITDWVLVDYPNHGKGKIWKLRSRQGESAPSPPPASSGRSHPTGAFDALIEARAPGDFAKLEAALAGDDPFLHHAAVVALSRSVFVNPTLAALENQNPKVRLGALLALRRSGWSRPEPLLRKALADADEEVCRAALLWIGEASLTHLRADLDPVLERPDMTSKLFETWLATVRNLDPNFVEARRTRSRDKANQIRSTLPSSVIENIVRDESKSASVRALALTRLDHPSSLSNESLLIQLSGAAPARLRREAIRTLAHGGPGGHAFLTRLALDPAAPVEDRAEALAALGWSQDTDAEDFLALLDDPSVTIRVEATRITRGALNKESVGRAFQRRLEACASMPDQAAFAQQLEHALFPPGTNPGQRLFPRPHSLEAWIETIAHGGHPAAGERLFHSASTGCSTCHTIRNRGGRIGPDLSNLGQSVSRAQIVHSILRPSDQFAPQWQAWFVETRDGEMHQGLQLDHKAAGAIELFTTAGKTRAFPGQDIARYGALPNSLMPDGLEAALTVEDFRNLAAFLESLK